MNTNERLPPQSKEAEQGLLGSIFRENSILAEVCELVTADSFYFDAHQKIYRIVYDLYVERKPVDLVVMATILKDRGDLEDIGGYQYLVDLWDRSPTAANAQYYAEIVRDKSDSRKLIHVSTDILRDAYDQSYPVQELIADAQRKILEIGSSVRTADNHKLADVITEVYETIDKRASGEEALSGVPSGLIDLDELTGGFHPGELCIIAARPSVGKTALAITICRNAAVSAKTSLLFSLEQSRLEIASRLLCAESGLNSTALRNISKTNRLSSDAMERLTVSGGKLKAMPIWINDSGTQRTRHMASSARRLSAKSKLGMIVVDYLQLIEHEGDRLSTNDRVSNTTRSLKLLARDLNIPVIVLSQLSRKCEEEKRRPRLSDLRDSGSIEQDADTVIFLHRPGVRDASPVETIEAIVAKQRNGPCSEVSLAFRKTTMRFENKALDIT